MEDDVIVDIGDMSLQRISESRRSKRSDKSKDSTSIRPNDSMMQLINENDQRKN